MKINKMMVSLLATGVMTSPLAHATNGYFAHGYGIKAKGMADCTATGFTGSSHESGQHGDGR